MKTLHEYLAEYLKHKKEDLKRIFWDGEYTPTTKDFSNWLEEGIAAYQTTENCTIVITGGDCPECGLPLKRGTSTIEGGNVEVLWYSCPDCDCGYEISYSKRSVKL